MEMGTYRLCVCFTRKFKFTEPEAPPDVKEAFEKYAEGGTHMTAEQLRRFLNEVQGGGGGGGGGGSIPDAEEIVQQVLQRRHHITKFTRHTLTLDDFYHYLFSGDLNPPIGNQVHQDMRAPLSHYFIYTGHNSYLTGNQLNSDCSHVPIVDALKRGVRVVELDLWPTPSKDDVHVRHGWTLTTPVKLIKCLRSIKEHAFSVSPYPVVITFEDHLTPDLQDKVAEMVNKTFGDMLFLPKDECLQEFPTPEDLKNRIIISTKPPKKNVKAKRRTNDKRSKSEKEMDSDDDEWGKEPSKLTADQEDGEKVCCTPEKLKNWIIILTKPPKEYLKAKRRTEDKRSKLEKEWDSNDDELGKEPSELTADQEDDEKSDSDTSAADEDDEASNHETCQSGASAYKRLIAIPAGKPKGGLKKALKVEPDKVRRLSLSEQAVEKSSTSHRADVIRFTQKNFLRIYPKGTRFTSSNYKPLIGWTHGAQMVAFNMQGYGRSLWLMHGMFRANGGCGYVKKPNFLMNVDPDDEGFYLKEDLPVKKTLKVKVYIGYGWHLVFKPTHFDSYSPPDFYTRVGIAGVPADKRMEKTETKTDNWAPVWDEEFTFPLTVPELAFLRVEVHEYDIHKDDFAGQTCLPVSELRPGIRAVPLFNRKGHELNSVRLLMRFEFL